MLFNIGALTKKYLLLRQRIISISANNLLPIKYAVICFTKKLLKKYFYLKQSLTFTLTGIIALVQSSWQYDLKFGGPKV